MQGNTSKVRRLITKQKEKNQIKQKQDQHPTQKSSTKRITKKDRQERAQKIKIKQNEQYAIILSKVKGYYNVSQGSAIIRLQKLPQSEGIKWDFRLWYDSHPTIRGVQLTPQCILTLSKNWQTFKNHSFPYKIKLNSGKPIILLMKDEYRGLKYGSLRGGYYYNNQLHPTKHGINITINRFEKIIETLFFSKEHQNIGRTEDLYEQGTNPLNSYI